MLEKQTNYFTVSLNSSAKAMATAASLGRVCTAFEKSHTRACDSASSSQTPRPASTIKYACQAPY